MKKITIILAMLLTLATAAFANEKKVSPDVLQAFKNKFSNATEVSWETTNTYYKAAFEINGTWLNAYYSNSAQLLCVTRNISSAQLPLYLQNNLKQQYKDYWITDLFELTNEQGFNYYLTVQDSDYKIMLESKDGSDWKQIVRIKY